MNGKGVYKPDAKVTRAEAAVMLSRILNSYAPTQEFSSNFADINKHWAKEAIMALEEKKLLGGYEDGDKMVFKPEGNITRAEIGVILVRIAGQ